VYPFDPIYVSQFGLNVTIAGVFVAYDDDVLVDDLVILLFIELCYVLSKSKNVNQFFRWKVFYLINVYIMKSLCLNKYTQIFVGLSIILFIIFPSIIPSNIYEFIGSTLGIVSIFAVSVSLFCFANTILAILFVLLAYILLQKCCKKTRSTQHIQYTPTQKVVDTHMFPAKIVTLEEQVVNMMAPLGNKEPTEFIDSSYKPMFNNLNSASLF
jgi:hypothetical protein